MVNQYVDVGVASKIGTYSDGMLVDPGARWLFTSGTPGLNAGGATPEGITAQADQAWKHVIAMLEQAGMTVHDLVKVTHYLIRSEDIKPFVQVRARYLGDARPASMLVVVPALVRPEFLVEVEAIAAKR